MNICLLHYGFFSLALALLVIALRLPAKPLLLLAFAAGIAGGAHYLLPSMTLLWQGILFVILSLLFVFLEQRSRRYAYLDTLRPKQFIGETFLLTHPIKHGRGKCILGRAIWPLQCKDELPAHTQVQVINSTGATLIVEKTDIDHPRVRED